MSGECSDSTLTKQSIILFYKYHPLSPDFDVTERYRLALEKLCNALCLKGRILVGCSKTEGLNGTLSGTHYNVTAFTWAMLKDAEKANGLSPEMSSWVNEFWSESKEFFDSIQEDELVFKSPNDFKWSSSEKADALFPDLNIKLTKELIGSGGKMSSITVEETSQGYLSPKQWHDELAKATKGASDETVIIDCRNTKEFDIGRFPGAIDPRTTVYSQFPHWVEQNKKLLDGKKVLMYCTGGIRCEKASAFIRKQADVKECLHLRGGIHKYLEEFGSQGLWKGKNFVFDSRQASSAEETQSGKNGTIPVQLDGGESSEDIVGQCLYCGVAHDTFEAQHVCAVCREPVLICNACQQSVSEYHCKQHFHLKDCFFMELDAFSSDQLRQQLLLLQKELDTISVGRRFRQKRKTITRQCARIAACLEKPESAMEEGFSKDPCDRPCRSCGAKGCPGDCWGFHGLKRKERLDKNLIGQEHSDTFSISQVSRSDKSVQQPKKQKRGAGAAEIMELKFNEPPSSFRDSASSIRCPPCVTRVVKSFAKAKWCGEAVIDVLQKEFAEFSSSEKLQAFLQNGLIKVNNCSVSPAEACHIKLKSGDLLSRAIHWHEPPVLTPETLQVSKIQIPAAIVSEYRLSKEDSFILVVDKPSSVPVHPAGPYLANSLTVMVEAQESLESQTLKPIHRTDRVTSGLTLLSNSSNVAKIFHRSLTEASAVKKLYLAKVSGHFPTSEEQLSHVSVRWSYSSKTVLVDAPIFTPDPTTGIRTIDDRGKSAQSIFKLVSYNEAEDISIVACYPVTGRNHQLRVHLQALGFPIVGDVQYDGAKHHQSCPNIDTVVHMMHQSSADPSSEKILPGLNMEDILAARKVCPCCTKGVEESFTQAQLLQEGHAICLHALCYRVHFVGKKKSRDVVATAEFSVGLPSWLDAFDDSKSLDDLTSLWDTRS